MQQFLTLPNGESLAYHRHLPPNNNNIGVLFCCGFRSSMNGNKALKLEEFCRSQLDIGFTRFDYRGHGESSCCKDFESLGMSDWMADARAVLKECSCKRVILVGSSMGAWIALQLALEKPERVAGILGIAAAPDFTVDVWKNMTTEQQTELITRQRVLLPSEYSDQPYPISRHLLQDANQWLLFDKKILLEDSSMPSSDSTTGTVVVQDTIDIQCPVRLVHGQQDKDISWKKSLNLVDAIASEDVQLTLIKTGDHRLSTPKDLEVICRVLEELVEGIRQSQS